MPFDPRAQLVRAAGAACFDRLAQGAKVVDEDPSRQLERQQPGSQGGDATETDIVATDVEAHDDIASA